MVVEDGERKGETQQTQDLSYGVIKVALGVEDGTSELFNQSSLQAVLDADQQLRLVDSDHNSIEDQSTQNCLFKTDNWVNSQTNINSQSIISTPTIIKSQTNINKRFDI